MFGTIVSTLYLFTQFIFKQLYDIGTNFISILQGKQKGSDVKWFVSGYTAGKWQGQDSKPGKLMYSVLIHYTDYLGLLGGSDSKKSACNAGDSGSIPGSGRSPGEGNGYPL